jgi:uncharacterized membrane protein
MIIYILVGLGIFFAILRIVFIIIDYEKHKNKEENK